MTFVKMYLMTYLTQSSHKGHEGINFAIKVDFYRYASVQQHACAHIEDLGQPAQQGSLISLRRSLYG